jgi:hypothetical protein
MDEWLTTAQEEKAEWHGSFEPQGSSFRETARRLPCAVRSAGLWNEEAASATISAFFGFKDEDCVAPSLSWGEGKGYSRWRDEGVEALRVWIEGYVGELEEKEARSVPRKVRCGYGRKENENKKRKILASGKAKDVKMGWRKGVENDWLDVVCTPLILQLHYYEEWKSDRQP